MPGAVRTDISGAINLVDACLKTGFEAFVSSGTSQEYGFKDHPPSETEWLDPRGHHAWSRAAVTTFCLQQAK